MTREKHAIDGGTEFVKGAGDGEDEDEDEDEEGADDDE